MLPRFLDKLIRCTLMRLTCFFDGHHYSLLDIGKYKKGYCIHCGGHKEEEK